jgi:hypothetical protein
MLRSPRWFEFIKERANFLMARLRTAPSLTPSRPPGAPLGPSSPLMSHSPAEACPTDPTEVRLHHWVRWDLPPTLPSPTECWRRIRYRPKRLYVIEFMTSKGEALAKYTNPRIGGAWSNIQSSTSAKGSEHQSRPASRCKSCSVVWHPHQPRFTTRWSAAPRDPSLCHAAAAGPTAWSYFLSRSASAMNRMPKTIE